MLELKKISVSPGGVAVLRNLSLRVRPGDKLHISGPSGSGKSTLLRALLFFERFEGDVLYNGENIRDEAVSEYRSHIAFLGQHIPPYAGTAEQVLFLPFQYSINRVFRPDKETVLRLLAKFRLEKDLLSRPFSSLSGGQQQRLMLVQILLLGRPFLVLDEPTSGLDPANRRRVAKYLCGLKDVTLLAVSHDPEWGEAAGRCLHLSAGRLRKGRCDR